jgi:hypothetical protein
MPQVFHGLIAPTLAETGGTEHHPPPFTLSPKR